MNQVTGIPRIGMLGMTLPPLRAEQLLFFYVFLETWRQHASGNTAIAHMLAWAARKGADISSYHPAATRCAYSVLARTYADDLASTVYNADLALIFALDSSLAHDLDLAHARNLALDRDLTRSYTAAVALALALFPKKDSQGKSLLVDFAWAYVFGIIGLAAIQNEKRKATEARIELLNHYSELTAALQSDPNLQVFRMSLQALPLPALSASDSAWLAFVRQLCQILQHYGIGQELDLSWEDRMFFESYLTANLRLVECLELAAVTDRAGIKSRLLLPPKL